MTLGNKIAELRKSRGMTQDVLAKQLNVTNQAVSKWEADQCCPDVLLLPLIADIFEVSLDELFGREKKKEAAPPALPWEDDGVLRAVLYAGTKLIAGHPAREKIQFCYEGPALNIHSEFSVVCDEVAGSINAGGNVTCDGVRGSVHAGGDLNCDDVEGDVYAGGDVSCDDVEGNVSAGGDVSCDSVGGSVRAGGDISIG